VRNRNIGHFISGREVKGTSGRTADVFEPMTGEVQAKVALASKAELRAAVEDAKAAQPQWGNTIRSAVAWSRSAI
jgi:malonate-semialdehyde dehydrogenase (acetylating) / methylmalonate-semialdehyde dehydrogenase